MHLAPLIYDLAVIISVAGVMSLIFQWLRQPVVLGYILAGLIVGPHTPPFELVKEIHIIQTLAELGVIFLMFTLGLEFSFRKLLSVGVTAGIAATFEVVFFLFVGYGVGRWLGWSVMDSIFLGAMLSISSTTIIIKALDELKLKSHRFASLIFGILIVEDLFAILLLVGLTAVASSGDISFLTLGGAALNLVVVTGSWLLTGFFILPRLMAYVGRKGNNEILTLVSIGLCLSLVVVASHFGYSAALGAFIMGSILAETKIIHQIESLMGPLKDLFGAIFFVSIGMLIDPRILWENKETIALLCLVTVAGKIFITSLGALISGQSFRNSLQVGFGLAQIGEFSFIIASLGLSLKAISEKLYPIAVAVSLVTTFTTPYLIKYSGAVADRIEAGLPWWVRDLAARYVAWCEHTKGGSHRYREIAQLFFRWAANGIVVTIIFGFCFSSLAPLIEAHAPGLSHWRSHLTWVLAFLASSPFLWGMVFTSRRNYLRIRKEKSLGKALVVLSFPVLTSIWVGALSAEHFPVRFILPFTSVCLVAIYFSIFKRLESYYRWLEGTFLKSFEKKEQPEEAKGLSNLAPWDSHLVSVEVHPNAHSVNRSLQAVGLRSRFGVNVVAIQRGIRTIVSPKPDELIMPNDRLVVLGTDEQIDRARPELEIPENVAALFPSTANYRLRHLRVGPDSSVAGRSIRQSGLREKFDAMVVGIERARRRIINPDTDLTILADDVVWVVGEETQLERLFKELG